MVLRLLLILIAFVVLLRLLGWRPPAERRATRETPVPPPSAELVRCARCGLHLPRVQALDRDGHWYCSAEHRDGA